MKKQSKPTYRIYFQENGIYYMNMSTKNTWLSEIINPDYFLPYNY